MVVDQMSVVDPEKKVYGIKNLRVVDSSIMPNIISGNINAATLMIAEKASDLILGKQEVNPIDVEYYHVVLPILFNVHYLEFIEIFDEITQ